MLIRFSGTSDGRSEEEILMKVMLFNGGRRKDCTTDLRSRAAARVSRDAGAGRLGTVLGDRPAELLYAFDTLQFDDYGRYEVNTFDPAKKTARRREVFPEDLEKAYRMGQELSFRS